jgi:hypothetical protein
LSFTPAALRAAHAHVLAQHRTQFEFVAFRQPELNIPPWLQAFLHGLGEFLSAFSQVMVFAFLAILGLAIFAILVLIARGLLGARWPWRRKRRAAAASREAWRPEAQAARALLADADRLAAEGRFDEAAHLLLFRSIDDIEDRRPRLVSPAQTARDIAALAAVPTAARAAFAEIVAAVERSLFGGRPVGPDGFARCRTAYEAFAFPTAWT